MTQLAPLPIAPTPNPALPEGEKGPPIVLQYWEIARRHLWLILSIVGVTLVAGIVITLLLTPRYTATARIEIQREQANVGSVQTLQPEQNAQNLEFYQTQYSLLNARSLAERVAKKLRLAQNQQFLEAHDQGLPSVRMDPVCLTWPEYGLGCIYLYNVEFHVQYPPL